MLPRDPALPAPREVPVDPGLDFGSFAAGATGISTLTCPDHISNCKVGKFRSLSADKYVISVICGKSAKVYEVWG